MVFDAPAAPIDSALSPPLFSWVLENLIRNAVDAMDGIIGGHHHFGGERTN